MISLRQHAISLAAVFVALAIGIVLGSGLLSSGLVSGLRDDKTGLETQVDDLQATNNQLGEQLNSADGFGPHDLPDDGARADMIAVVLRPAER